MYTYDSPKKLIVQSIIERHPSINHNNKYKAQLFNDVKDINRPGDCGGLYTGEYISEGFIGTYMLRNQITQSENVMISCVNNLVNPNQQLGLVSGLSNYTMLPITFKTIISNTKITDKDILLDTLLFSKEDFRILKKTHFLTVHNSR